MSSLRRALIGEVIGTFLLIFFGCGAVAAAVTTGAQVGVFQVAIVWGLGIALAIHCTAALSGAHINPAVTLAFMVWRDFPRARVVPYIVAQCAGAFLAAATLYLIFGDAIRAYEAAQDLVRGEPGSEATAMIFGEYFPNPNARPLTEAAMQLPLWRAAVIEVIGTAVLVLLVFALTEPRNPEAPQLLTAAYIGLTVTLLISLLAPLTMACFNPARDFAPRVFSALAGWGSVPFTANGPFGWWLVYIVAPIAGGWLGGGVHQKLLAPAYAEAKSD